MRKLVLCLAVLGLISLSLGQTCPPASAEELRCLREWACQYVISLDLRCLIGINGKPLLGNLVSLPGLTGGNSSSPLLGG
nr:uncharacterized protein LOC108011854 [Drosophila suzukii]